MLQGKPGHEGRGLADARKEMQGTCNALIHCTEATSLLFEDAHFQPKAGSHGPEQAPAQLHGMASWWHARRNLQCVAVHTQQGVFTCQGGLFAWPMCWQHC